MVCRLPYQRSHSLAVQHPQYVFRLRLGKDNDRDAVVHRQGCSRGIHDLEPARKHLVVGDPFEAHGLRVLPGIVGINAVDVFGEQNGVRMDLRRAQHRPVSVEKKGEPVPPAKSTISPFSIYSMALRVS